MRSSSNYLQYSSHQDHKPLDLLHSSFHCTSKLLQVFLKPYKQDKLRNKLYRVEFILPLFHLQRNSQLRFLPNNKVQIIRNSLLPFQVNLDLKSMSQYSYNQQQGNAPYPHKFSNVLLVIVPTLLEMIKSALMFYITRPSACKFAQEKDDLFLLQHILVAYSLYLRKINELVQSFH